LQSYIRHYGKEENAMGLKTHMEEMMTALLS